MRVEDFIQSIRDEDGESLDADTDYAAELRLKGYRTKARIFSAEDADELCTECPQLLPADLRFIYSKAGGGPGHSNLAGSVARLEEQLRQERQAREEQLRQERQARLELEARLGGGARKRSRTAYRRPDEHVEDDEIDLDVPRIWKKHVDDAQVQPQIKSLGDILPLEDRLRTSLRWLYLTSVSGRTLQAVLAMQDIVQMRLERKVGAKDLEVKYHKAELLVYQAAAAGQPGVQFAHEDQKKANAAREDFQGLITSAGAEGPHPRAPNEAKAYWTPSSSNDPTGISQNKEGIGKVLKSALQHCMDKEETCTLHGSYITRLDGVWIIRLIFEMGKLKDVHVAPFFPRASDDDVPETFTSSHLKDLKEDFQDRPEACLADLLELEDSIPPGFQVLVRYVAALCKQENIPVTPVALELSHSEAPSIALERAEILHAGHRSVVLLLASDNGAHVWKISSKANIERERFIHSIVDGCSRYVRPLVSGLHGRVVGCGEGLEAIALSGVYVRPLSCEDVTSEERFAETWDQAAQALGALHGCNVLYRDPKPKNILVGTDGILSVNDFDLSCRMSATQEELFADAGSERYRSPAWNLGQEAYSARDDWLALGLTFADLRGLLSARGSIDDKWVALRAVVRCGPESLRNKLQQFLPTE